MVQHTTGALCCLMSYVNPILQQELKYELSYDTFHPFGQGWFYYRKWLYVYFIYHVGIIKKDCQCDAFTFIFAVNNTDTVMFECIISPLFTG